MTKATAPLALLAAFLLASASAAPAAAAEVTVQVQNNLFTPRNLTIQAGDTVVWVNNSGVHNVVANDGSFSSGDPTFGWTYRRTFAQEGTVFYYCQPHAIFGMRGQIRVVAAQPTVPAPTALHVAAHSKSELDLTWSDNATNETGYRVERAALGGAFEEIAALPAGAVGYTAPGLTAATFYRFRVRAVGTGGVFSNYSAEGGAATDGDALPCIAGPEVLCLSANRFRVNVAWKTTEAAGNGSAVPIASAPDSGLFYFFSAANIEMLVKTLDACAVNQRFWVFFAATTNVELTLTVLDTQTGKVRVYFNPQGQAAAPVQDTDAFPICGG